jgi:tRNA threonylcarbamoyl adenosine modification protein YjeE
MPVTLPDERALEAFARTLAAGLTPGDVLALRGPLGAGKTTLVRALVRALHGSDAAVSSPTFIFRQSYAGQPPVEHLDLYRLEDPAELVELGLEEAFAPDRITLVEWPERAPGLLPAHARTLVIAGSGDGPRTIGA